MKGTKTLLLSIALMAATALSTPAQASSTERFAHCMADSLNGKERKQLAGWIFFAMAAHPEISPYSQVTDEMRLQRDKEVGALITRLLTQDCPQQFVMAQKENPQSVEKAFEMLGQVAMQELMTNPAVGQALSSYSRFTDFSKINSLMAQ